MERLGSLSAFLPARNEEANLLPMARAVLDVLPDVADAWELIIVDDGSRDGTGAIADALARREPGVRVVRHRRSGGYGAALRAGVRAARYDFVFYTDADRQFDVAQLPVLIRELDRADVVVGYRYARADPLPRRLSAAAWNRLVRRLFRLPVRDVNCAFKLFRRSVLAGLRLETDGATISTEIMARLGAAGARIVEVPVDHFPRRHGAPSGGELAVIARAFVELAHLRRHLRDEPARDERRRGAERLRNGTRPAGRRPPPMPA